VGKDAACVAMHRGKGEAVSQTFYILNCAAEEEGERELCIVHHDENRRFSGRRLPPSKVG